MKMKRSSETRQRARSLVTSGQYDTVYREYKRLYDYFGRGGNDVMRLLREARRRD